MRRSNTSHLTPHSSPAAGASPLTPHPSPAAGASPARGFTLLEVMVALAVLAIALAAMMKGVGAQVSNQSYLRDRTLAHWVAMNKAAELQIARKWPETGSETGSAPMGPHEWYWKVTVQNTPDPDVRRMDVAVSASEGGEPVTSLVGYLLKPNEQL